MKKKKKGKYEIKYNIYNLNVIIRKVVFNYDRAHAYSSSLVSLYVSC